MLAGCTADARDDGAISTSSGEVIHPVRDSLLSARADVPVRVIEWPTSPDVPAAARALTSFDGAAAYGDADGERAIGSITDAVITADGDVVLLDGDYTLLRVATGELEPVRTVGRAGQGPGEFVQPVALFTGDGRVGVLDSGAARIEWIQTDRVDGEPQRLGLSDVLVSDHDACTIGSRLFVMGTLPVDMSVTPVATSPDHVHELRDDGAVLRSFSAPYALTRNGLAADVYSIGRLECDESEGGRLWAAYATLGEVHALSADGELKWIARLADFERPRYLEVTGVSMGVQRGQDIARNDHINRIVLLSPSLLAVQLMSRRREDVSGAERPTWRVVYETYLLDPSTGERVGAYLADHQLIGSRDGRAILYRDDPHPQVSIVELSRD